MHITSWANTATDCLDHSHLQRQQWNTCTFQTYGVWNVTTRWRSIPWWYELFSHLRVEFDMCTHSFTKYSSSCRVWNLPPPTHIHTTTMFMMVNTGQTWLTDWCAASYCWEREHVHTLQNAKHIFTKSVHTRWQETTLVGHNNVHV